MSPEPRLPPKVRLRHLATDWELDKGAGDWDSQRQNYPCLKYVATQFEGSTMHFDRYMLVFYDVTFAAAFCFSLAHVTATFTFASCIILKLKWEKQWESMGTWVSEWFVQTINAYSSGSKGTIFKCIVGCSMHVIERSCALEAGRQHIVLLITCADLVGWESTYVFAYAHTFFIRYCDVGSTVPLLKDT